MSTVIHYQDTSGADRELVLIEDTIATAIDPQVETRFTNENLQRRVDVDSAQPDKNQIVIRNRHSYRTITEITHDEASTTSEIP